MAKRECLSCFENMREYHSRECAAYNAQVAWNKKMRAIMKRDGVIAIPKPPNYAAHTDWVTSVGGTIRHNTWQATMWTLLHRRSN